MALPLPLPVAFNYKPIRKQCPTTGQTPPGLPKDLVQVHSRSPRTVFPGLSRESLNKSVTWVFIPTRRSCESRDLCPQRFRFLPSQERRSITFEVPAKAGTSVHTVVGSCLRRNDGVRAQAFNGLLRVFLKNRADLIGSFERPGSGAFPLTMSGVPRIIQGISE